MKNQTTTTEKKEALKAQIKELVNSYFFNDSDAKNHIKKVQKLEKALKDVEREELLQIVNAKHDRLRAAALEVWEAERPTEDITTQDGSLHKVKAKKYPKIAALQYLRLRFDGNQYVKADYNGQSFTMCKSVYEYNKPTQYKDFADFNEFLAFNSIMVKPITRAEFDKICTDLEEANNKLDEALKAYKLERERLHIHRLQYWGLIGQSALHEYKYTPNK
jgi:hypothetical protein